MCTIHIHNYDMNDLYKLVPTYFTGTPVYTLLNLLLLSYCMYWGCGEAFHVNDYYEQGISFEYNNNHEFSFLKMFLKKGMFLIQGIPSEPGRIRDVSHELTNTACIPCMSGLHVVTNILILVHTITLGMTLYIMHTLCIMWIIKV